MKDNYQDLFELIALMADFVLSYFMTVGDNFAEALNHKIL